MHIEIDGASLPVSLHEFARVAELAPLHERRDAPGAARAARRAPDTTHVLDAVAREVKEHDVVDGLKVHAARGAVSANEQPRERVDALRARDGARSRERTCSGLGREREPAAKQ